MEHIGPEVERLLQEIDARRSVEAQRGVMNWLLAPTIDIYHALQNGESVPLDQLRPETVTRYGLKNGSSR